MTREGKLWHFPIDNEMCMKHEEGVNYCFDDFYLGEILQVNWTEHIFLNRELDSMGVPAKGAVRDFMELVRINVQC